MTDCVAVDLTILIFFFLHYGRSQNASIKPDEIIQSLISLLPNIHRFDLVGNRVFMPGSLNHHQTVQPFITAFILLK